MNYEFTQPRQQSLQEVVETLRDLEEFREQNLGAHYGGWQDGQFIGLFTINGVDWRLRTADLGYWLIESATGKGHALTGLRVLTNYCFESLGLASVTAHVATTNLKSQKVLRRAGFQERGLAAGGMHTHDRFVDQYLYIKSNDL